MVSELDMKIFHQGNSKKVGKKKLTLMDRRDGSFGFADMIQERMGKLLIGLLEKIVLVSERW